MYLVLPTHEISFGSLAGFFFFFSSPFPALVTDGAVGASDDVSVLDVGSEVLFLLDDGVGLGDLSDDGYFEGSEVEDVLTFSDWGSTVGCEGFDEGSTLSQLT